MKASILQHYMDISAWKWISGPNSS